MNSTVTPSAATAEQYAYAHSLIAEILHKGLPHGRFGLITFNTGDGLEPWNALVVSKDYGNLVTHDADGLHEDPLAMVIGRLAELMAVSAAGLDTRGAAEMVFGLFDPSNVTLVNEYGDELNYGEWLSADIYSQIPTDIFMWDVLDASVVPSVPAPNRIWRGVPLQPGPAFVDGSLHDFGVLSS